MSFSVSRLTNYVVLSSIEDDLKNTICDNFGHLDPAILLGDIYPKALDRFTKDNDLPDKTPTLYQILFYVDYGDLIQIINGNKDHLPSSTAKYFKSTTQTLEKLIPIRNRVAHSRPLKYDDLAITLDTADLLVNQNVISWKSTLNTLNRLKDEPSFVLGISIPSYGTDESSVHHNLPIPDFDETGFLGRKQQVEELEKLCLGPYPVITIVGEGGIGKTALALRVAYDILDMPKCPFDAIVWTSSKTTQLTPQEIIRIQGAINDSLGMFQNVAKQLGADQTSSDHIAEVLDYLREFRILLIMDNLETVLDDRIQSFLGQMPSGSKVLITSRIGLGAFEYPYRLLRMDEEDAAQLLRALSRVRGVPSLSESSQQQLIKYCNKMKNNPGYIKWFVSAVQAGKRPEEVFANSDLFLEFCMSNVYHFISENGRKVLRSSLCLPGKHSQAELCFINDLDALSLQQILHELLRTNMFLMSSSPVGSSFETSYELSELARAYLSKKHPVSETELVNFTRKNRQIIAERERFKSDQKIDPYSIHKIQIRSQKDLIIAKYLSDALKASKDKDFENAETYLFEARQLAPEYFEVYRVEAFVKTQQNNYSAAYTAYEQAIELEPLSAPLRKWYGKFLLKNIGDCEAALKQLTIAHEIDPKSVETQIELARVSLYLSRFSDAMQLLEPLISIDGIQLWNLRKAYDLYFQCLLRGAEFHNTQHNEILAIENLEQFTKTYNTCPANVIDEQIVDKLMTAREHCDFCMSYALTESTKKRAKAVNDTLELEYRKTNTKSTIIDYGSEERIYGIVKNRLENFGFVEDRYGQTFWVHNSEFLGRVEGWFSLKPGDRVSFIVGEKPDDPSKHRPAILVRLEDSK